MTGPSRSSRSIRNSTARTKSSSWIQETYCAPPATGPPSPKWASRDSTLHTPPRSGLMTFAERSAPLRVAGVGASACARSQFSAISTLYAQ